jgi:hypothetical protein
MSSSKIYLETSMFSFYHEEREGEEYQKHKAEVRAVFDLIKAGKFEPYTSLYAVSEINDDPDKDKRKKMQSLISEYGVKFLEITDEVERLATLYSREGVVSPAYTTDASHSAVTAVNGLDFIVSLNFTHIARTWTIERVRRVNARENYKGIGIYKPAEVLEL